MTDDVYRAHSFEDLINALPTFFGFMPRESVVGLTVKTERCAFGFRLRHDLPDRGDEAQLAAELAPHLVRHGGDGVFVIAVSADRDRARTTAWALRDALPPQFRWLTLWADDERVWSDVPGQPAEGEPYRLSAHHESIVRAVANGQVILGDRSDVAAEVAGASGARARRLDEVNEQMIDELVRRALTAPDPHEFTRRELQDVTRLVDRVVEGQVLTERERVELAVRVSATQVRDEAWCRITRQNARQMHELWASVARVAAPDVAPAALCLAGFAAWQAGDGARAMMALERALGIEPDYRMGQLLAQAVQAGLHPDIWAQTVSSA